MKRVHYEKPNSSFLSLEKDYRLIINKLLDNEDFKKLLYRTDKTCLSSSCPNLSEDEVLDLITKKYVKIVPKVEVDPELKAQVIISFDNFIPSGNLEFRDCDIIFDILCNFKLWELTDFQLRPYRIAAEIDSMLDKKHLTGIGQLNFVGAQQIILTDEFAGLCLLYDTIHGGEDKKYMPNPADEQMFIEDYFKMPKMN